MPLVTYPGGQRERDIYLYWWDKRDGDAWSGWGITPDFPGNQEFILHGHGPRDTKHPARLDTERLSPPKFKVCARDTALVQDSSLPTARTGPCTPTFAKRLTSRRET